MIPATRWALFTALAWFLVGNTIGLLVGAGVLSYAWRPAHAHAQLLGFVTLMIQGVAYHAVPRFAGVPFRRSRVALLQVLASNVALMVMVAGWGLHAPAALWIAAGTLAWLAGVVFVALLVEVLARAGRPFG